MTIEHSVSERHALDLSSADPFGFAYETEAGRTVTIKVTRISFTIRPGRADDYYASVCHLHGRLLRKTGGEGRDMLKSFSAADQVEMWNKIPRDIQAAMIERGFAAEVSR